MYRYLAIFLIILLPNASLFGQKMVYDSVLIEFGFIKNLKINAYADTVLDKRSTKPASIGVYEKVKYLFIPVDKYVMLYQPLSGEIKNLFSNDSDSIKKIKLEIRQFDVNTRKRDFLSTSYICNAAISVYSLSNNKENFEGTFLYENEVAKTRKSDVGYEAAIDDWKIKFIEDMQKILNCNDTCKIYNFRKEPNAWRKNMLVNSEFAVGPGSWLIDAEIVFSRPESEKKFYREGSCLRLRKEKKYESFETSLKNKQTFIRLNDNYLFVMKTKTFLGLNRWNANEYKKHGLEDVFLLDISLSQQIMYNKFYKRSITAGLGIMEDVTYLYSENFKFHPYLLIQLGIKL
jgi:hypothetical protein